MKCPICGKVIGVYSQSAHDGVPAQWFVEHAGKTSCPFVAMTRWYKTEEIAKKSVGELCYLTNHHLELKRQWLGD
jgi:hypothetical protein